MLTRSWADFKAAHLQRGRVVDPAAGGVTTSQAQALAMLRSVYMDDRTAFEELWAWTRARLQVRGDGLLTRRYGTDPAGGDTVLDRTTASTADQDAALALLFASKQWRMPVYHQQALEILDGIWRHETAIVAGKRIMLAGDSARSSSGEVVVSPAALQPYAYRVFGAADSRHPWAALVDSSYHVMTQIQPHSAFGSHAGVVPNLIAFDMKTGDLRPAARFGGHADEFSGDASSVPVRFALDLIWSGEQRAQDVLDRLSLPRREIVTHGWLASSYDLRGEATVERESVAMYAGILPSLLFQGNDDLGHLIFADRILRPAYDQGQSLSVAGTSVEDLTWAWVATAFMHGGLANLWQGEATVNWPVVLSRIEAARTANRPGLPPEALDAALAAGSARSTIVPTVGLSARPAHETVGATAANASRPDARSEAGHRRPRPVPSDTTSVSAGAQSSPEAATAGQARPIQDTPAPSNEALSVQSVPDSPADAAPRASAAAAPPIQPAAIVQTSSTDALTSVAPPTRPSVVPVFRPTPPK